MLQVCTGDENRQINWINQYHISSCLSYQASSVRVDAVGRVDKLRISFGVLRKLLVVVEPAVHGRREALILQTPQLGRCSNSDCLRDAAPWDYRFHCTQTHKYNKQSSQFCQTWRTMKAMDEKIVTNTHYFIFLLNESFRNLKTFLPCS